MKEKKLTIMLIALLCAVVQGALAQNNPILWDFEDEAQLDGWTLVDNDGDEFNWKYYSNTGRENGRMTTHSGDGIMMSASYDNEEMRPLSPDNWLISPEVTLGGTLSLWACGQDDTYCHEIFAVYVSVDGMTNGVGSELVDDGHFIQVGTDITTTGDMIMYAFNLKQFEGTTGRFAIRHYKTTDEFILNIDDIELDTDKEYIPDPTTPTNLTVALAATTAEVTWDGAEDDKWNLRYKVINPNETVNLLWDLTEDNYESQTKDWTVEDRDGDGYNWGLFYSDYDPTGDLDDLENIGFCSDSYNKNDGRALKPNNWLISPELPLGGTFTFYAQNDSYPADVLGVYVITDEGTFQIGKDFTPPKEVWEKYSFDTSDYNGQVGKIAIVHHNCTDGWHVYVDYISYIKEGDSPATWTEVNGLATTSCTLTDLDPETKYEVQVQAYNQKGESTWTGSIFTTTKLTDVTEIGSGTEADPYIITTIAQMQTLATKMNNTTNPEHFVGVHFALGNDLDFSGETFTTIATGAGVKYYFSGTFDGRGHTISGINFDSGTSGRRGIFGLVRNGGTVKNLTLKSSTIKGGDATGGIVGRLMAGCLVENCHVESDVTVTGINYAGGVVGYNLGGTIRACSSAANVSGSYYIGGITGACDPGSTVENCFYYGGSITGTNVGAIVGIETHPINTLPNYNYLGNLYYTTANIKGVDGSDKDGAERGYKIISGTDDLTFKYNNNGSIIRYDNDVITKIGDGLYYKGVYYGKANGSVNIVASIPSGTITKLETDNGTLTGSFNAYKLTFADADATITAIVADEPIDVTLYDNDTDATEENASIISANDEQYANVTLSGRTLYKDGCWNTLCLPFDFVIEGSPLEDATIMVLDGEGSSFDNETGTLTLNFTDYTETVFTAGTACIVKWASGSDIENPVFNGAVIKNVQPAATSSSDNAVTFVGLYSPKAFTAEGDKTILYLGADDKLHYSNGEMTIYAFRSYFQLNNGLVCGEPDQSGGVNAFVLNFGHGNETAISLITYPSSLTFDAWYTIDGRKLIGKPTTKGIYINNGRKVVIK